MTQVGLCPKCLGRMRIDGNDLACTNCDKRIPLLGTPRVPYVQQETSVEAAGHQAASGKAGTDEVRVLTYLKRNALFGGATDDEIEANLGMIHQTASARRRGLVIKGLVAETEIRRNTRSGRKAIVWRAT